MSISTRSARMISSRMPAKSHLPVFAHKRIAAFKANLSKRMREETSGGKPAAEANKLGKFCLVSAMQPNCPEDARVRSGVKTSHG